MFLAISVALAITTAPARSDPPPPPAAATEPAKLAVPDDAALRDASKLIAEAYRDTITKATTPPAKAELARTFLKAGIDTHGDPAGRYQLLLQARDSAVRANQLEIADDAIAQLDQYYVIDALLMRLNVLMVLSRASLPADEFAIAAEEGTAISDEASMLDRFKIARDASQLAVAMASKSGDTAAAKRATARLAEMTQCAEAFEKLKPSLEQLAQNPVNPDANLAVGEFRCFDQADWSRGLPLLAAGSDPDLVQVARREQFSPQTADEQVSLGDEWIRLSAKRTGLQRQRMQQRAGHWYEEAISNLSGLPKASVEAKLRGIPPDTSHRVLDLLKLVDLKRDGINGAWVQQGHSLVTNGNDVFRLQFPYRPPAEYDLKIEFARKSGKDAAYIVLSEMDKEFYWAFAWGGQVMGFGDIAGQPALTNASKVMVKSDFVQLGKTYKVLLKVRRNRIRAFIDGELVNDLKTTYSNMSLDPHNTAGLRGLGLQTWLTSYSFSRVEVTEISGRGKLVLDGSPKTKP